MGENKDYIIRPDEKGSVNISEDVVAVISASAALEVDGVACLSATQNKDFAEYLSKKSLAKGVRILVEDQIITIDLYIMVKLGFAVNDVGEKVQKKVITAVESMTGFTVEAVNVHISGIMLDKQK